jgi:hypothetical protein
MDELWPAVLAVRVHTRVGSAPVELRTSLSALIWGRLRWLWLWLKL